MGGFISSYLKTQSIENQNEEACEEIQTDIDQFIKRISNDNGNHKNHCSEWKIHVMSSADEKI